MNSKRIIWTLLTLLWLTIIFIFSAQPAPKSADLSGETLGTLKSIFKNIPFIKNLLELENAEFILRKFCHMCEYAVLLILFYNTYSSYFLVGLKTIMKISLFSTIVCASFDETHQKFVSGRSGQFTDVVIDTVGAVFAILMLLLIRHLKRFNKSKNKV